MAKGKNKFNQSWLHDHINDPYVKLAQREGYRARAAYKLKEIDDQDKLIQPGSVIVDLAAPNGGNCPLTEAGKTVVKHGVTIVGETNLPALVAADASALYARNVLDFLKLVITKEGTFHVPMDDDIVAACLMTQGGEVKRK